MKWIWKKKAQEQRGQPDESSEDVLSWVIISVMAVLALELTRFWFVTGGPAAGFWREMLLWVNTVSGLVLVGIYLTILWFLFYSKKMAGKIQLREKGIIGAAAILALLLERALELELYGAFIGVFGTVLASTIISLAIHRQSAVRQ